MGIVSIMNQKGGVGKTTLAFNLAKGLAARGYKVLAIDNDPQGNLTSALLEDPRQLKCDILDVYQSEGNDIHPMPVGENLYLIGATIHLAKIADNDFDIIFKLKENLAGIKNIFDFVVIDCLPSFGFLNMAAMNASDYVLIPAKPAPFAMAGLKDLFETIEKAKHRLNEKLGVIGIVLNLVEGRQTTIGGELEGVLRDTYGDLVFSLNINKGVKLEESPVFSQSIMEYDPKGKQASQFNQFIDEFLRRYNDK